MNLFSVTELTVCAILVIFLTEEANGTTGCTFPKDLRGLWSRSRDQVVVTFSDSQLTGLDIRWNSQRMNTFDCYSNSYNTYIINSSFTSLLGVQNYYVCWSFVKVTSLAYIMYELSETINSTSFDANTTGYVQSPESPPENNKVCSSQNFFTTLIKNGVTSTDVAVPCPTQLNATFTYSVCPSTELNFCPEGKTGKADYNMCSTPIFHSADGLITCMGSVTRDTDVFLNLFTKGKVICFKLPDNAGWSFSGVYYTGDCTTVVSGGFTSITLTQKNSCVTSTTTAATTTIPTTTTAAGIQPSPKSETTLTNTQPSSSPENEVGKSKGGDSVTVGVAVGITVGLFTLFLLALLLFLLVWRQKLIIKVSDFFSNRKLFKTKMENKDDATNVEIFKTKVAENFPETFRGSSIKPLAADSSPDQLNEGASINADKNGVKDTCNYTPDVHNMGDISHNSDDIRKREAVVDGKNRASDDGRIKDKETTKNYVKDTGVKSKNCRMKVKSTTMKKGVKKMTEKKL